MPTAAEAVSYARRLLRDTAPNGAWSDAALLDFLDQTSKQLMRDIMFPPARISTQTIPNLQSYQMPFVLKVLSVYVNGQLCSPTDQATLQGQQIGMYDQGIYGSPSVQTAGSAGPSGTTGTFTPQWNVQPPQEYPVNNSWGSPRPDAQPWSTGQPPRYFWRGGYLILVPAPANGPPMVNGVPQDNLVIDCVMLPPRITSLDQPLWYNEPFIEALAQGIVWRAKYADSTNTTAEQRNFALQTYRQAVADLRMWKASYDGDAPKGPKFQSSRGWYLGYRRSRVPRGGGGYP